MIISQPATVVHQIMSETAVKPDVLGQVLAQRQGVTARLAQIRFVVAVMSGKGGVGKSVLTANLAAALAMNGCSVGVLDADIHGPSAAAMLGARGQRVIVEADGARPAVGMAGVRVMSMDLFLKEDDLPVIWKHPGGLAADTFVWRGTMEANVLREFLADTQWGRLDYLLIDMPPGTDRLETLLRLVPSLSGVLAVTIPSQVSHLVVQRSITAAKQSQTRVLGLVENMAGLANESGVVTGELFPGGQGETFAAQLDIPYLGKIPFDSLLARTTDSGRPFVLEHGDRAAGQAILALARRLEQSF
jgi:ATP-binding protein involved in chromosome partitioning